MKTCMKPLFLFIFVLNFQAWGSFLPEDIEVSSSESLLVADTSKYQRLLDDFIFHFAPIVVNSGGELKIRYDLNSDSLNAYASRQGRDWIITLKGGLFKSKKVDEEILSMILCHELGHHIGGDPYKFPEEHERGWISVEGQSDYFAANICGKTWFRFKDNELYIKNKKITSTMKLGCREQNLSSSDNAMCLRMSYLSAKMSKFMAALSRGRRGQREPTPKLETPDSSVVSRTLIKHPKSQCRIDTYFQGALCKKIFIAPDSNNLNCLDYLSRFSGARPRCWFAP